MREANHHDINCSIQQYFEQDFSFEIDGWNNSHNKGSQEPPSPK